MSVIVLYNIRLQLSGQLLILSGGFPEDCNVMYRGPAVILTGDWYKGNFFPGILQGFTCILPTNCQLSTLQDKDKTN